MCRLYRSEYIHAFRESTYYPLYYESRRLFSRCCQMKQMTYTNYIFVSDCCSSSRTGWLKAPLIHQDRKCQRMRRSGSTHDECGYRCVEFEVPVGQVKWRCPVGNWLSSPEFRRRVWARWWSICGPLGPRILHWCSFCSHLTVVTHQPNVP